MAPGIVAFCFVVACLSLGQANRTAVNCVCVCVCTISVIGWRGELFRKGWRGGLQLVKQIIHQAEKQKKFNQTTGVPSLLCVILGLRLKFKHELVS